MKSKLRYSCQVLVILILTIYLSACSAKSVQFTASVDGLTSPDAEVKKKYVLVPGLKDVGTGDLQFKEFAGYVDRILASLGFAKADNVDNANAIIYLSYGISDPQKNNYSYVLPVWGQTGVSSSYTTGQYSYFGGTASYSGTTTYTPQYGVTGYMPVSGSYDTYQRYIMVDAYDLDAYRKDKQIIQIWKTLIYSAGSTDDLRIVFPVLIAASKPYIGKNTEIKRDFVIDEQEISKILLEFISPGTIGVKFHYSYGSASIDKVISGSPAEKAGIKVGDTITRIDGNIVFNSSQMEISQKLFGRPGEKIALQTLRMRKDPNGDVKEEYTDYVLTRTANK